MPIDYQFNLTTRPHYPFSRLRFFSPWRILLSFCVAMKEILKLAPGHQGAVWRYASRGPLLRRPHRHDELELNLITDGKAKYLIGERRYDLSRRTLIWLFPEQDHLLLDESANYAMWILVIAPDLLRTVCRNAASKTLLLDDPKQVLARSLRLGQSLRLSTLFEQVGVAADPDRANAGLAYAVLSAWSEYNSGDVATLGFDVHPAVEKAARILKDETEPENFEALAEKCGLSRSRLSRLFKQQAGVSLVEYRQRQCLERFLALYGSGRRITLLDAALQAGFGSYPNFHRIFKHLMKQSPADYRRKQQALE
jgi:AraC-like DNA-binding protein